MSTALEELQAEAERLWTIELVARRAAIAAEKRWRDALKEYYDNKPLAQLGLRRTEE